jgi:hypothetical protein
MGARRTKESRTEVDDEDRKKQRTIVTCEDSPSWGPSPDHRGVAPWRLGYESKCWAGLGSTLSLTDSRIR